MLGIHSTDVLDDYRKLRRAIEDLPADLRRDIDSWDPSGTARFIFASPLADSVHAAGRRAYAGRPLPWTALEDKVRIDGFWDAIGVRRAPSRIVAADHDALRSAAKELDRGLGTVWAADARDGTHGSAMGLRWVRPGDDGRESFVSLRRMADRIRVMPFLDGIPASIHGIVFPDSVAVFRPVEMVVLRPTTGDRLHYAGCATAFDPLTDDRNAMRDLAYRVGAAVREAVGYRGPFGIDRILAEGGYLPTELNARAGGAMKRPLVQGAGLPLTPLCLAVTEGERLDYRPDLLQRAVVESTDAHRTCAGWSTTPLGIEENRTLDVVRDRDEYRERRAGEGWPWHAMRSADSSDRADCRPRTMFWWPHAHNVRWCTRCAIARARPATTSLVGRDCPPIFACRFRMVASCSPPRFDPGCENTSSRPSMACRFQALTWFACTS